MTSTKVDKVVVPIDATTSSARALPVAAAIAAALGASVDILAIAKTGRPQSELQRALASAAAGVSARLGEARVAYDFAVADRVVAAASLPNVIACMATGWRFAGSTGRRVFARSDGPVLLVGPAAGETDLAQGLVVALTTGDGDAAVAQTASAWAHALRGDELVLPAAHHSSAQLCGLVRDHRAALAVVALPVSWAAKAGAAARRTSRFLRCCPIPVVALPRR